MSPATTGPGANGQGGSGGWTTGWQRLSQTFLRPATLPWRAGTGVAAPDITRMTDDEKRALITRVDPTERKVGLGAVVLAVVLAIYANVPYMVSKIAVATTVKPKGKTCAAGLKYTVSSGKATCNGVYPPSHYVLPLVVSLVLAVAIYVTVRIRRRAPLAFTVIINGLAFGSLFVLLPFALAGGWIMLRAWRTQRYGAPNVKAPLEGWVPPPPRGTRRAKSTGPAAARPSRRPKETPTERKPPSANKRYTPKTPAKATAKKKATPPA
jgi:hypothetical protein